MAKTVNDPVFGTLTWDAAEEAWGAPLPVDYFKKFGGDLPDYGDADKDKDEDDDDTAEVDPAEKEIFDAMSSMTGIFNLLKQTDEFMQMNKLPPEGQAHLDEFMSRIDDVAEADAADEALDPQALFAEGKFKVTVAAPRKGPSPAQREAWQRISDAGDELWSPVLRQLFEVYRRQRPARVRWWSAVYGPGDPMFAKALPELKSAAGLRKLIRPLEFRVHAPRKRQAPLVGVHFDCAWDRGDGFGVLLRDGQVIDVGVEDVALEPPPDEPAFDHPVFGRLREEFDDEWVGTLRFEPFRDFFNVVEERESRRVSPHYDLPRWAPPWDFIEGEFDLTVHLPSAKGPSKAQEQLFREFIADEKRSAAQVLDGIFRFYQEIFDDARQGLDEDADRLVPPIKSPDGLRELITFHGMSVYPGGRKKPPSLGLTFDCCWDEEHGLGVLWRNGKVEEVGQADVAIDG